MNNSSINKSIKDNLWRNNISSFFFKRIFTERPNAVSSTILQICCNFDSVQQDCVWWYIITKLKGKSITYTTMYDACVITSEYLCVQLTKFQYFFLHIRMCAILSVYKAFTYTSCRHAESCPQLLTQFSRFLLLQFGFKLFPFIVQVTVYGQLGLCLPSVNQK